MTERGRFPAAVSDYDGDRKASVPPSSQPLFQIILHFFVMDRKHRIFSRAYASRVQQGDPVFFFEALKMGMAEKRDTAVFPARLLQKPGVPELYVLVMAVRDQKADAAEFRGNGQRLHAVPVTVSADLAGSDRSVGSVRRNIADRQSFFKVPFPIAEENYDIRISVLFYCIDHFLFGSVGIRKYKYFHIAAPLTTINNKKRLTPFLSLHHEEPHLWRFRLNLICTRLVNSCIIISDKTIIRQY